MTVLRSTAPYALLLIALAALLIADQRGRAEQRLNQAQEYEQQGLIEDAVEQYEWAIQAYTPGSSTLEEAVRSLRRIAENAERAGSDSLARSAWQSIVSGISVIDHLWTPCEAALVDAQGRLADLEKRMLGGQSVIEGATP